MKKLMVFPIVLVVALVAVVVTPYMRGKQTYETFAHQTQDAAIEMPLETFDIAPAMISMATGEIIAPMAAGEGDPIETSGGPADLITKPMYTQNNEQVYMLVGTGMDMNLLVTDDYKPIANSGDGTVTAYDTNSQEFIDGANRKLAYYLDSFLDRAYLRSGNLNGLDSIRSDREVFLINIKKGTDKTALIYAFREKVDHGWTVIYKPGRWFNTEYRYFDMNNRQIDNECIVSWDAATYTKSVIADVLWFGLTLGVGFFITLIFGGNDCFDCPFVKVLDKTTLGELREEISYATIHPWATITEAVTEDGKNIYIRPSTNQLVDFYNYPLFHIESGLPLFFHENKILTTALYEVQIVNGILSNVITTSLLIETSMGFYVDTQTTLVGEFDVVVINYGTPENPDFRLPNGQSTEGITDGIQFAAIVDNDGQSLWDWMFGGINLWDTLLNIVCFLLAAGLLLIVIIAAGKALINKLFN